MPKKPRMLTLKKKPNLSQLAKASRAGKRRAAKRPVRSARKK